MSSINDPHDTVKKAAEPTEAETTSMPGPEPDLVDKIKHIERDLEPDLKRAQEAAHERQMMTSLHLAAAAAKRLTDLRGEEEPDTDQTAHTELTEPTRRTQPSEPVDPTESTDPPPVPPLALRGDGKLLLSVTQLAGADLTAREQWTGVVLTDAEALSIHNRLSDACAEAAGYAAGRILWNGNKSDRGENEGGGHD